MTFRDPGPFRSLTKDEPRWTPVAPGGIPARMNDSAIRVPATLTEGLTAPQREAVLHRDGPLLVLAAAGSGKTRVITRRAAALVLAADAPIEVLAMTFTNKAADEMSQRLAALGVEASVTACTFHGFGARLLRVYAAAAGIEPNFTILDRDDRRKTVADAVESAGLSLTHLPAAAVEQHISRAKNAMIGVDAFAASAGDFQHDQIARVYRVYEARLVECNALDFDDLLLRVARLLEEDGDLRDRLERRYPYVLVDEYQDTNAAQYRIARLLTRSRRNLCATGDPDQSIYAWRGADLGNILSFERDFPDARVVRLEQNYRSSKRILAAAAAVIAASRTRPDKALWTHNPDGDPVRVVEHDDASDEADWIAEDVAARVAAGARPCDVAILYRMNAQSRAIEEALLRAGVAYQIARGVEFYARKEIKDVLAYLRLLLNLRDEQALLRAINTPARGIGGTTLQRLEDEARARGVSLAAFVLAEDSDFTPVGRAAARVRDFAALMRSLSDLADASPSHGVDQVLRRTGLAALYLGEDREDASAADNVRELQNAAADFERRRPAATLRDWLEYASLVGDVDALRDEAGCVTLMTLHAVKGLEFPEVYIAGLEDGVLPLRRETPGSFQTDEEEERRLFFVGMTRAMQRLTITWAKHRMLQGRSERRNRSPFLADLPRDRADWIRVAAADSRADFGELPSDVEHWSVGTLVREPRLGLGRIDALARFGRHTNVTVTFRDGVRRTLILEFAHLTRVDPYDLGDAGYEE